MDGPGVALPHPRLGNVVGKPDRRGNLYPATQRPERKIDAAVAVMMAVGRATEAPAQEGSSRERAELWTA